MHDSWWPNESVLQPSSTIIDYHAPFDRGLSVGKKTMLIGFIISGYNNLSVKRTYSFKNTSCAWGYVRSKAKRFVKDIIIHFCCIPTIKWRLKEQDIKKLKIIFKALCIAIFSLL